MNEQENKTDASTPANRPPKITKHDIEHSSTTTKGRALLIIKSIIYTVISSLLIAVAAYSLITPNNFTIGGVSGIAILLEIITHGKMPQSIGVLALNLPLIVLAVFFVKKKFAILSTANILLQSLWLFILENLLPNLKIQFTGGESEKIFAALAAGVCIGAAIALAFKVGGSTGGTDILAVLIQKKITATSISSMIFMINCVIIGASLFVFYDSEKMLAYNLLPIMLATFESYIESKTNESVTYGFQSAIEFRIITDKPEEMSNILMRELSRGVTSLPATGMYTNETHSMLLCVVSRRQAATVRRIMKTVDPDSFAVMSNVSQVLGLGFYREEV